MWQTLLAPAALKLAEVLLKVGERELSDALKSYREGRKLQKVLRDIETIKQVKGLKR